MVTIPGIIDLLQQKYLGINNQRIQKIIKKKRKAVIVLNKNFKNSFN